LERRSYPKGCGELEECTIPSTTPAEPGAYNASSISGPTWTSWNEILAVVLYPAYLKRTVGMAFVVGTILFAINHLDAVVNGQAGWQVWLKGMITYLVPFFVSNWGVLTACRRRPVGAGGIKRLDGKAGDRSKGQSDVHVGA